MSFDRTSNGKSTVMNAMLRQRILPVGMGHTTNCFLHVGFNFEYQLNYILLQIEGTDKAEPSLLTPGSDEPKCISVSREKIYLLLMEFFVSLQNLSTISNALSKEKLDSDSLVKILWPKDKCRLIRDDVVLVDR